MEGEYDRAITEKYEWNFLIPEMKNRTIGAVFRSIRRTLITFP